MRGPAAEVHACAHRRKAFHTSTQRLAIKIMEGKFTKERARQEKQGGNWVRGATQQTEGSNVGGHGVGRLKFGLGSLELERALR
mmetsp:Transcript_59322/g.130271  ORF Transcript_59322/g.130271 Transcript_59322/m.130271 type:complete len:84 (+) Transcript_59322:53-304(+)